MDPMLKNILSKVLPVSLLKKCFYLKSVVDVVVNVFRYLSVVSIALVIVVIVVNDAYLIC